MLAFSEPLQAAHCCLEVNLHQTHSGLHLRCLKLHTMPTWSALLVLLHSVTPICKATKPRNTAPLCAMQIQDAVMAQSWDPDILALPDCNMAFHKDIMIWNGTH